jgi:hypothetical protein
LHPDAQPDDLALKAEYVSSLESTPLDESRPQVDLSMTVPGQLSALEMEIKAHHAYLQLEQEHAVTYEEAVVDWYDTVYSPVMEVIRNKQILSDFPGRTEADLYSWLCQHRAALEEALGQEVQLELAAADLARQLSSRPQRVVARAREKLLDAVTPDPMQAGPSPGAWRTDRRAARLFPSLCTGISASSIVILTALPVARVPLQSSTNVFYDGALFG